MLHKVQMGSTLVTTQDKANTRTHCIRGHELEGEFFVDGTVHGVELPCSDNTVIVAIRIVEGLHITNSQGGVGVLGTKGKGLRYQSLSLFVHNPITS